MSELSHGHNLQIFFRVFNLNIYVIKQIDT